MYGSPKYSYNLILKPTYSQALGPADILFLGSIKMTCVKSTVKTTDIDTHEIDKLRTSRRINIGARGILRDHVMGGPWGRSITCDGRKLLNFAGCNYLAITDRPELKQAALDQLNKGGTYAHPLDFSYGGVFEPFERVELAAANFFGCEDAMYLSSGYLIGFAAFKACHGKYDVILLDEKAHWTLQDGARVSGLPVISFKHGDLASLWNQIDTLPPGTRPLVATDAVFAASGNCAPIAAYVDIAERLNGMVIVDESHSAGVLGETGMGAAQLCGVFPHDRVLLGATFSKAFCSQGAIIVGSQEMIDKARMSGVARGSSAGSAISAAVSAAAITLVKNEPHLFRRTLENSELFRQKLRENGIQTSDTNFPVVSFKLGDKIQMRQCQQGLFDAGIYVMHSIYVGTGSEGVIRATVFRDHQADDFDRFIANVVSFSERIASR